VKESGGNINSFEQLLLESELDVYAGDDSMTVPVMALGTKGVVSVMANIMPREMHELCKLCLENNILEAGRKLLAYGPLMNALFIDVNPIPVKAALNLMGKNVGKCRLPLVDMDDAPLGKLYQELKKFNLCN
jgi:4-hydroxy-tetrahydrodipicolinate synthase